MGFNHFRLNGFIKFEFILDFSVVIISTVQNMYG